MGILHLAHECVDLHGRHVCTRALRRKTKGMYSTCTDRSGGRATRRNTNCAITNCARLAHVMNTVFRQQPAICILKARRGLLCSCPSRRCRHICLLLLLLLAWFAKAAVYHASTLMLRTICPFQPLRSYAAEAARQQRIPGQRHRHQLAELRVGRVKCRSCKRCTRCSSTQPQP